MNPNHIIFASNQIKLIAVGICRTDRGNTHTGVAYRHSNGKVHFFHQAWDHDTRDNPIAAESQQMGGPFFCITPTIEDDRAMAIASFWEFVASRGEQIAYALRDDPEALFDPNTGMLAIPNGRGLSCSTFVLVLFRSVRFPYIDTTGWPVNRPGDAEFQARLVNFLDNCCDDKEHVEAVRMEIGCERIRPEEVAGAALYLDLPVRYHCAEDAGIFVRGSLCVLQHQSLVGMP